MTATLPLPAPPVLLSAAADDCLLVLMSADVVAIGSVVAR